MLGVTAVLADTSGVRVDVGELRGGVGELRWGVRVEQRHDTEKPCVNLLYPEGSMVDGEPDEAKGASLKEVIREMPMWRLAEFVETTKEMLHMFAASSTRGADLLSLAEEEVQRRKGSE